MADEAVQDTAAETQQTNTAAEGQSKTFTQEELDRIVEQRLARTKAQFKDFDQYKQAAQKLADLEAANQTESEKLRSTVEKARQQAQEATEREQRAVERANNTLVRAAVISEASRQKAIDPDAVYALLDRSHITLGDDDRVEGVEEAVQSLLSERTYLVGTRPGGFDGGARDTAPVDSRAEFNAQIRRAAGFQ